jgi:hypothetical protein
MPPVVPPPNGGCDGTFVDDPPPMRSQATRSHVLSRCMRRGRQRDPPAVGPSDRRLCACPEPSLVPVRYRETQLHRFNARRFLHWRPAKPCLHALCEANVSSGRNTVAISVVVVTSVMSLWTGCRRATRHSSSRRAALRSPLTANVYSVDRCRRLLDSRRDRTAPRASVRSPLRPQSRVTIRK